MDAAIHSHMYSNSVRYKAMGARVLTEPPSKLPVKFAVHGCDISDDLYGLNICAEF